MCIASIMQTWYLCLFYTPQNEALVIWKQWDNYWYQIPGSPDLPSIWYWMSVQDTCFFRISFLVFPHLQTELARLPFFILFYFCPEVTPWNMCIASIMQTWYLCLFYTQVYCIVCIFPCVTQKCVVLTLSIPRYYLKL
jgi:hypothetical protein